MDNRWPCHMEVRREEAQAAVSNQQNPGKVKFDKSL
jgi:hypothetical protein